DVDVGDVLADRLGDSGEVAADALILRPEEAADHRPHEHRDPAECVVVAPVDRARMDADEYLVVRRLRLRDLGHLGHVARPAPPSAHHRLHRLRRLHRDCHRRHRCLLYGVSLCCKLDVQRKLVKTMATRSRTRKPLTKERVLEQAIALADADGIESLSMRKLGQALGVEAMSLSNYVANKGELIAAMVDWVLERFELPDDEPRWDAAIRRCAISAHDLLLEHAWACSLALLPSDVSTLSGPRVRYMEWLLRRLREAGFSADLAYSAYHTLDSHIFGFTLWQIGHAKAARMMA